MISWKCLTAGDLIVLTDWNNKPVIGEFIVSLEEILEKNRIEVTLIRLWLQINGGGSIVRRNMFMYECCCGYVWSQNDA